MTFLYKNYIINKIVKSGDFDLLILQKGFNYSQDGPGNRLVYHLQGCNFACRWCSNADSIPRENPKAKQCSIDEVFDEIMRSRMMFFDGGGVTFTGGEASLQADELIELLKKLKKKSISTCIETNGSSKRLPEIAEYVDYLIVDLKHWDDEIHKKWTFASNETTKKNIEYFLNSGREIHIRIPVINGINDSPQEFAEFFSQFDASNADFEFLAYHEFGKDKWKGDYQIENGFVSPEKIKEFTETFRNYGLKTVTS